MTVDTEESEGEGLSPSCEDSSRERLMPLIRAHGRRAKSQGWSLTDGAVCPGRLYCRWRGSSLRLGGNFFFSLFFFSPARGARAGARSGRRIRDARRLQQPRRCQYESGDESGGERLVMCNCHVRQQSRRQCVRGWLAARLRSIFLSLTRLRVWALHVNGQPVHPAMWEWGATLDASSFHLPSLCYRLLSIRSHTSYIP